MRNTECGVDEIKSVLHAYTVLVIHFVVLPSELPSVSSGFASAILKASSVWYRRLPSTLEGPRTPIITNTCDQKKDDSEAVEMSRLIHRARHILMRPEQAEMCEHSWE